MYNGIFRSQNETWLTFNAGIDEYPPENIVKIAKAIVIPGSRASSYDNKPWIFNLKNFLKNVYK